MTQELRKLAEAATQGEWHQTPPSGMHQGRMIVTDERVGCIGETHNANAKQNAAYIAAVNPAVILALLDRVERAEKDAERYRWLRSPDTDVSLVIDKRTGWVPPDEHVEGVGGYHTYEYRAGEELDTAIDSAMEASK